MKIYDNESYYTGKIAIDLSKHYKYH